MLLTLIMGAAAFGFAELIHKREDGEKNKPWIILLSGAMLFGIFSGTSTIAAAGKAVGWIFWILGNLAVVGIWAGCVRFYRRYKESYEEPTSAPVSPENSIADRAMQRKASQKMICPNCSAEYDGYQLVCLKCHAKLVAINPAADESGKN